MADVAIALKRLGQVMSESVLVVPPSIPPADDGKGLLTVPFLRTPMLANDRIGDRSAAKCEVVPLDAPTLSNDTPVEQPSTLDRPTMFDAPQTRRQSEANNDGPTMFHMPQTPLKPAAPFDGPTTLDEPQTLLGRLSPNVESPPTLLSRPSERITARTPDKTAPWGQRFEQRLSVAFKLQRLCAVLLRTRKHRTRRLLVVGVIVTVAILLFALLLVPRTPAPVLRTVVPTPAAGPDSPPKDDEPATFVIQPLLEDLPANRSTGLRAKDVKSGEAKSAIKGATKSTTAPTRPWSVEDTSMSLSTACIKGSALAVYPQDVELPLQLAWVLFRSGNFSQAEQYYRMTLTRTAGGGEAELGLAWSVQKQDDCQEAISHFRAVLAAQRISASAKEGLALCIAQLSRPVAAPSVIQAVAPAPAAVPGATRELPPATIWARPQFSQALYLYHTNPMINYVAATTPRLELLIRGHYYAALTYRYSHFVTLPTTQTLSWNQHELYLDAGYTAPIGGFTVHYALSADGSGLYGNTSHIGVSARYSGAGDLVLDLAGSFYSDSPVLRGELSWRVPIYGGFSVRPGGALQWTSSGAFRR